ncbi:tRNA (adenosine(37)-N6)-threonylcarbamoyltransferase complex dimerization subunit type 1 TsaB [Novosphingobium malaysiense]|uniref:Peptidase M22 n=1 Tax=Novosphingobium malaysiense TaxID=1348853 RepID=A0A0B1ZP74_9SPHN|nr:tRNA (adenosine(37)-N6)-threonylcarbamoyltransferase complex dimerization subunit type 1 TsaB [Novosphingobium malaysiense]KHK92960.1 peptidase M22 [Novosphingobium malaysiense]
MKREGRTLVIDCATDACSVALFDGSELVAGDLRVLGRGHAEALVPMIAALPGRGRSETIAVSLGPGSFTGVRVGLAAARALALAWSANLTGYSCLALVAALARQEHGPTGLDVAMTGGHGEWFVQSFDTRGHASSELASLRPEAASQQCRQEIVAGSQAQALVAARGFGHALPLLPDARAYSCLAHHDILTDVRPLYGRAPDAKLPGGKAATVAP